MKKKQKKSGRKLLGFLITLVMVVGIMPGMSLTVQAGESNPYASLLNSTTVVTFGGKSWYLIEDNSSAVNEGTVTLLSKECVAASVFDSKKSTTYSGSTVETVVENYYTDNFTDAAKTAVVDNGMFLLTDEQAKKMDVGIRTCSPFTGAAGLWWLCSKGNYTEHDCVMGVYFESGEVYEEGLYPESAVLGVRPALKLDLSMVTFNPNNCKFSIGKLEQTVNAPTAVTTSLTYSGQAQALLDSGASVETGNTSGTIQYSLTPDDDTSWVDDYTDVKATNAGIHKVYYRVAGNDTYDDFVSSDEQAISVTIAKADPATPTGITAKYCDNTGEIDLPKGWTWQDDWYYFYNVGKDTCKANFAGNNNYNAKTDVDITVTVEKADAAISYEKTEVSVEYGAEFGKNEITNPGDAEPTFTSTNKSVATVSETGYVTIKGIGETTITATIEDNAHYHYTTTQASYKLTVNPVTTEITTVPTAAELTFGQKLSESTLTGGKAVMHGKWAVDGTFAWKEPDTVPNASDSGEYVVVFTPDNANYSTAECNVNLTVKKASPTVTAPTAKTLNYTGSPASLVNAGSTGDGTLYYALGENGTTAPDFDGASDTADKKWNTSIPTATDAGTYYVWYKVVGDENHNDVEPKSLVVTINEKQQTSNGTISTTGIYCASNYPTIQAGINIQKSNEEDTVEYRWVACDVKEPLNWFEVSPWTKENNWMDWTPEKSGGYVFVCYARVVGNEEKSMIQQAFGTEYHRAIKAICQMPYTGKGGGYLIGIESFENPNISYQYEILILDCNLYIQGKEAWVYTTGKCGMANCFWTVWQPTYGYYWTLFRVYDANGNLLDEECYGFANIY